MRRLVVAALVAAAALGGAAQARAGVGAQLDIWAEAGEITAGPGPTTIETSQADAGAGGVAATSYGWPLAQPFPSPGTVACSPGGCAQRSAGATASVDEAAGVLKAGTGGALLVGNPPDLDYGGDAQLRAEATIDDAITLSAPATVWIEGTVHGSARSDSSDRDQLQDPRAQLSVALRFCCTLGWEGPRPLGGYDREFAPDANAGATPIDDTFSIPVDLPAGRTAFTGSLEAEANMLVDGVTGLVLAQDALLDESTVSFHVRVPDDVVASSDSGLLPIVGGAPATDTVAPTTVATPADGGWRTGPVVVHLAAADTGGSGVRSVTYSASGAQTIPETTLAGDGADVTVSADGLTTLTFHATDAAGNAEAPQTLEVRVDSTGPDATATIDPAPNAAGWNTTPTTVTLHAADAGAGVASITFHYEGAEQSADVTAPGDTVTSTFATAADEGVTTIVYHATDRLGNAGPTQRVTVRFDRIAPVLTVPDDYGVRVDATGLDGATVDYAASAVDDVDASPVVRCDRPSGSVFPIGVDEVTCTATDAAGNVATTTFRVVVRSAADQISLYLYLDESGLWGKAKAAELTARAGKRGAACNILGAYAHQLDALTGKWIDAATAARTQRDLVRIRRALGC